MEAITIQDHRFDIFTSSFTDLEISDDSTRAVLIVPLMHVGPNKKGLYWTAKVLKKIAPMFRSIPFRYDLNGSEGSSHTINKLSSPHFDVGWTYSSEDGAWYDEKTKTLWVKGEVTHPDVIDKLKRVTTDGKREVNYASMGVIVEEAVCSICGADFEGDKCENGHVRNQKVEGKKTYKVPTKISKALHAALTNDPADGEAEIKNVLFQELGYEAAPADKRQQAGEQMERNELSNQVEGGLAPSSPQTGQPGMSPSPEDILRDMAERVKTLEQKVGVGTMQSESPELLNTSPQDQFTQDNMGNTEQWDQQQNTEENKMDVKDAQSSNEKTPVNPDKKEMQDNMGGDPMSQIMGMLQQILQRLPGAETQDMGKEALSANKGQAKQAQADLPTEHLGEGAVGKSEDAGNAKNKANMMKPGSVATADDSEEEPAEDKEKEMLKEEVADLKSQMKAIRAKLEIQDNSEAPEFGGSNATPNNIDVADMGANGRAQKFGDYGKWDACFKGAESAQKFVRDM